MVSMVRSMHLVYSLKNINKNDKTVVAKISNYSLEEKQGEPTTLVVPIQVLTRPNVA